jgi:hypothetical protein
VRLNFAERRDKATVEQGLQGTMLWMLLVYVIASNGYNGQPSLSSSFHGATFPNKEDCETAARTVGLYEAKGTEDIGKAGLIVVCAPVLPPPPPPPPAPPKATAEAPAAPSPFPLYPPPKRSGH